MIHLLSLIVLSILIILIAAALIFYKKNIRRAIIVFFGGLPLTKDGIGDIVKQLKQAQKEYDTIQASPNELHDKYLFDFRGGYTGVFAVGSFEGGSPTTDAPQEMPADKIINLPATKIAIKPIDVLHELERAPIPFSLEMLDEKISVLKEKEKLISQHYAKRDVQAVIQRIENRKKYTEHKQFFDRFQSTTDESVDELLSKYKLVLRESDLFVPEFPDEAIKIMNEYTEQVEKISGKKPVFYVIAEEKDFQKKYERRDPILLAQSPFAFTWDILGAWDKEMILLSEL